MQQRHMERAAGGVVHPQFAFDPAPGAVAVTLYRDGQCRRFVQPFTAAGQLLGISKLHFAGIELRRWIVQRQHPPPLRHVGQRGEQFLAELRRIAEPKTGCGDFIINTVQLQPVAYLLERVAIVRSVWLGQLGGQQRVAAQRLIDLSAQGIGPLEPHPQRRIGQRGHRREIAHRRIGREIRHHIAAGCAHTGNGCIAKHGAGIILSRQGQHYRLGRAQRQPGQRAASGLPDIAFLADTISLAPDLPRPAQKALPAIEPGNRLKLRTLSAAVDTADIFADPHPGPPEQLGVGQVAVGFAQHIEQRFGEDPAAVDQILLGGLVLVASRHQHMAALRDHDRLGTGDHRGVLAFKVGLDVARKVAWAHPAHARLPGTLHVARTGPRMAAIEQPGDVRLVLGQFGDQPGQLLVGEVEVALQPAVVADQPFVALVAVKAQELGRRGRAPAVAAVVQIGDIVLAGLSQMAADLRDHVSVSGIAVGQLEQCEIAAVVGQVILDIGDIVDAAFERTRTFRIAVYPDQQRVDLAHSSRLSQHRSERPAQLLSRFAGQVKVLS